MSKELRVRDAFKKDAGKGIIRIDANVMNELNLKPNDVIEIVNYDNYVTFLLLDIMYLYGKAEKIK